jgi:two-component system LytT family response regulator
VVADMALLCLMLYAGGVGIYHALSFGARLHRTEARRPTLDQQLDTTDTTRASSTEASPDRILVIARNALVPIPVDAIRWIEAADAYVKLHTTDGVHLHRARLKNIAVQLAPKGFIRIHRSTVIRLDALDRVETASGGAYVAVLDDGTRRRVSQSYRADLLDALGATEDAL